jgi:tetraacyldisaccharide 4'-kinase
LPPQLARTDALIVVGDGSAAEPVAAAIAASGKPVFSAHLRANDASVASLVGRRVLAFAGIGDPARFFKTLQANGIEVVLKRAFADHQPFSESQIEALTVEAKRNGLVLVTTEKDLARLRGFDGLPRWAGEIVPFAVTLEFDRLAELRKFVTDRLFQARGAKFRGRD